MLATVSHQFLELLRVLAAFIWNIPDLKGAKGQEGHGSTAHTATWAGRHSWRVTCSWQAEPLASFAYCPTCACNKSMIHSSAVQTSHSCETATQSRDVAKKGWGLAHSAMGWREALTAQKVVPLALPPLPFAWDPGEIYSQGSLVSLTDMVPTTAGAESGDWGVPPSLFPNWGRGR